VINFAGRARLADGREVLIEMWVAQMMNLLYLPGVMPTGGQVWKPDSRGDTLIPVYPEDRHEPPYRPFYVRAYMIEEVSPL
jgi:hypothetical protein